MKKRVYIAADHAGFDLKEKIKTVLLSEEYDVIDKGAREEKTGDDYPGYMRAAAEAVASDPEAVGIIFGGSGEGEAMVANRTSGVRAAEYYGGNLDVVRLSREHNDANILSLGARFLTEEEAREAVLLWLKTPFSGEERHERRIKEIDEQND